MDIGGSIGTPVIAAADGIATTIGCYGDCGCRVEISHRDHYETIYCHLSQSFEVKAGQPVKRGDVIGYIGNTGRKAGAGFEHVHLTLREYLRLKDPLEITEGCFDTKKNYPTDRLVLTYPIRCGPSWRTP